MKLIHEGFFGKIPASPHDLVEAITPVEKCIVLCHLGILDIKREEWSLTVDGLVGRPRVIRFDDLMTFPKAQVESVHQCAGSPLDPHKPTQRVNNVVWGGARLIDVLEQSIPSPKAKFVWAQGSDSGNFSGVECGHYLKDLPLSRIGEDVLLAYELNGAPLPLAQGFPVRLVVPGFYGTNSVKWLERISLATSRASGPFTTTWYNDLVDEATSAGTSKKKPVWEIAPQSIVVSPSNKSQIVAEQPIRIWGWAWGDDRISSVRVSCDEWKTSLPAVLDDAIQRGWRKFVVTHPGLPKGAHMISSQAENISQEIQPLSSARNAAFVVSVEAR